VAAGILIVLFSIEHLMVLFDRGEESPSWN
jgi:hypothetical protein